MNRNLKLLKEQTSDGDKTSAGFQVVANEPNEIIWEMAILKIVKNVSQ
jgi:hypothetical protein